MIDNIYIAIDLVQSAGWAVVPWATSALALCGGAYLLRRG